MDAMILAAGLGTRLRPLTNDRPKALVEIGAVTMLERVARRLVAAGADRLIINMHPFPAMIRDLVAAHDGFGADVCFSHEPDAPLDTGGGLRRAASMFRREAPFFLHNCDVISDIDLRALYHAHSADRHALATLAVLPPSTSRYLVFDGGGLCGYSPRDGGREVMVRAPTETTSRHDFSGIHVVSPSLLDTLPQIDTFSIITHYLELAQQGARIAAHEQPGVQWLDIGTPEKLEAARDLTG